MPLPKKNVDRLVELGIWASGKELVKLAQQAEIWIVGLREALLCLDAAASLDVNTHLNTKVPATANAVNPT